MTESRTPRVGCFGVHIVDVLGTPIDSIPDTGLSTRIDAIRFTAAGTAAGTAVDLARLGCDVTTVGAVGDDEIGRFLFGVLERAGVPTAGLAVLPGEQTSATMLTVRSDGERPTFHVRGANSAVRWDDLDGEPLLECDAVHVGGLDSMASLDPARVRDLMDRLRSRGILVTLDFQASSRFLAPELTDFLPHCDVFLPNLEQAQGMTGRHDPHAVADALLALGAPAVALTMGADGVLYADASERFEVPGVPIDVVDTTGCGDALSATFLAARMHGLGLRESLELGVRAAAQVATVLGSDGLVGWTGLLDASARTTGAPT